MEHFLPFFSFFFSFWFLVLVLILVWFRFVSFCLEWHLTLAVLAVGIFDGRASRYMLWSGQSILFHESHWTQ